MRTYRYLPLSTMLMMSVFGLHAAMVPAEIVGFKTETDISAKTKGIYQFAGFLAGCTQQTITLPVAVAQTETVDQCMLGLLGQWIVCISSSICVRSACAENIRHLTAHKTECAHMIFNQRVPALAGNANMQEMATRHNQLQEFISNYKAGHHAADDYKAYNALLASNIKRRSFCEGYIFASILGPIPPIAAVWTLINLGLLNGQCNA